jgi:hypothetical protein
MRVQFVFYGNMVTIWSIYHALTNVAVVTTSPLKVIEPYNPSNDKSDLQQAICSTRAASWSE